MRTLLILAFSMASCTAPVCTTGDMRCENTSVEQCVAGQWEVVLPCGEVGRTCANLPEDDLGPGGPSCVDPEETP